MTIEQGGGWGRAVAVAVLALGLAACGSSDAPRGSAVVTADDIAGIWHGEQALDARSNDIPPEAVTSPVVLYLHDGRLLARYPDFPELVLSAEYTRLTAVKPGMARAEGAFTLYDGDKPLRRGQLVSDITREYDARTAFGSGSTLGAFTAYFDPGYRQSLDFRMLEGEWTSGDATVELVVDALGEVEGAHGDCGVTAGAISVLDPAVSLYDIELTLSGCGDTAAAGVYTGFVVLADEGDEGRFLHGALISESKGMSFELWAPPIVLDACGEAEDDEADCELDDD